MSAPKLNSIDDYEMFLQEAIEDWSPTQRTAFAAAMAERWLPVYEKFSQEAEWGDAPALRRGLEAVWNHLHGRTLNASDCVRHIQLIDESTPHMDDFDAEEALATCIMLREAMECCGTNNNHNHVVQAAYSGFEAVLPDWELALDEQPRLWKQGVVRKELRKQLQLIERISTIKHFDNKTIDALRQDMAKPEYSGAVSPCPEPGKPVGYTNQAVFEQHRRMVEAGIRSDERTALNLDLENNAYLKAIIYFSKWAGRYSRRRRNTDGEYAKMADTKGRDALLARQRTLDATAPEMPDWDEEVRTVFEQCMTNAHSGLDVTSLAQPHAYGPSLRRLWAEAQQQGKTTEGAWQHILDWARHRPTAWAKADSMKKKGRAQATEVGQSLGRNINWTATDDVFHPWAAEVEGQHWQVGVNDFPEDFMYSLLIDGAVVGDFYDWPETWQRP